MNEIASIQWEVPCKNLVETLGFYTRQLAFRTHSIFPADAPRVAILSGYGCQLRLEQGNKQAPGLIRLVLDSSAKGEAPDPLVSPDGTRIEFTAPVPELQLPQLKINPLVRKYCADGGWGQGRAGMQYRDLIPDRLAGGLIASHIRIPSGGPVPDYVHHHLVLFQVIYCLRGWVKVVYEDQGPPFVLKEGDCVLQPPGIRHQVLESSDGLEVVEMSAPAEHMTFVDHEMTLPTAQFRPGRNFDGQLFIRHQAEVADWVTDSLPGFDARDTGIEEATAGIASLEVLRANAQMSIHEYEASGLLQFHFILLGSMELALNGQKHSLGSQDVFLVPPGSCWSIFQRSDDLELMRLTLHRY